MDKSIGENAGFVGTGVNTDGASSDGAAVLDVLEIGGVPLCKLGLWGDPNDLGPNHDIR